MPHRRWVILFALGGCGSSALEPPDASVGLGDGGCPHAQAALKLSPTVTDFGLVQVNKVSTPRSLQLANAGGQPLTLRPLELSGSDFVIVGDDCTVLLPGSSCEVQVSFRPATVGVKAASLTAIASGPCGESAVQAALQGTGVSDGPDTNLEPIDFGSVAVGADSAPVMRTLTNTGAMPTGSVTAEVAGGDFSIQATTCGAPLPPGQSCGVAVIFHPTSPGLKNGTLTVRTSDGSSATATLVGNGIATPARLTMDKAAASFQGVSGCEPEPKAAVTFRITNDGDLPTGVVQAASSGPFSILVNECTAMILAPGASCQVQVQLTAQTAGTQRGLLVVSAAPGGEVRAELTGTVIVPGRVSVTPSSLDFGRVTVGAFSTPMTLELTNLSGRPLTFARVEVSTDEFVIVMDRCTQSLVPPGGACQVQVVFRPVSFMAKSAILTAHFTEPGCAPGNVQASLQGIAGQGAFNLAPIVLSFGTVAVGTDSAPATITATNFGGNPSGALAVALSGLNASQFRITGSTCNGSLPPAPPGGTCTVTVVFHPTTAGDKTASVTVSAAGGATATSNLAGSGL